MIHLDTSVSQSASQSQKGEWEYHVIHALTDKSQDWYLRPSFIRDRKQPDYLWLASGVYAFSFPGQLRAKVKVQVQVLLRIAEIDVGHYHRQLNPHLNPHPTIPITLRWET